MQNQLLNEGTIAKEYITQITNEFKAMLEV